MDYSQAVKYITGQCAPGIKPGLERVRELLGRMGNPERSFKCIHVTGTNGKGSTSVMLAEILHRAGLRTGLFTSPFIERVNEYMRVDGKCVSDSEYAGLAGFVEECGREMDEPATEFERSFAMAAEFFRRQGCDICVIEVGMGGRGDATNVIPAPLVAVLTHIGLDHVRFLGGSAPKIAEEKCGIIKRGCEAVCYPSGEAVLDIIKKASDRCMAPLHTADFSQLREETGAALGGGTEADSRRSLYETVILGKQRFSYSVVRAGRAVSEYRNVELSLLGRYQLKNAAVVLETVEVLKGHGYNISEEHVRDALSDIKWQARFEVLCRRPVFIADGGHNVQCAEALAENFKDCGLEKRIIFIFGVLADKDYRTMLKLLSPYARCIIGVVPDSRRALGLRELGAAVGECGVRFEGCGAVGDGVRLALSEAGGDGVICATGSLYMMAKIREGLRQAGRMP